MRATIFLQEMAQIQMADMDRPLTAKYEKKSRVSSHPKMQSVTQSNALDNWQAKMLERKKQQGYLSSMYHFILYVFKINSVN